MLFVVPIGFLKTFHRFPWANVSLIFLCVALYGLDVATTDVDGATSDHWMNDLTLFPRLTDADLESIEEVRELLGDDFAENLGRHEWTRQPWSLVTYAFLHGGPLHLFGNMAFLFVFGCALDSELGHARFLAFFALAAAVSGAGHLIFSDGAVIGASGAICGVTGMVAALYPRNDVRIGFFVLILKLGEVEWPSLVVIATWFGLDFTSQVLFGDLSGVAYMAHICGSLFGFGLGILALKAGWVESDGHDFLSWHLGADVARPARRHKVVPLTGRYTEPVERRPQPSQDREPIPMVGDPSDIASTRPMARANRAGADAPKRQDPVARPVYRQLTDYFETDVDLATMASEEADRLIEMYRRYCKVHAGATIGVRALIGMSRLCARKAEIDLALDAYYRLLRGPAYAKKPLVALEAAKLAARSGKRGRAKSFVKAALSGSLPPDQRDAALELQRRILRADQ